MEINAIKQSIVTNVYHISADTKVLLHKHSKQDEIFYCLKGSGFGVLEDREVELNVGECFIAPAGIKHSLRSDEDLYVSAFLIPVVDNGLD